MSIALFTTLKINRREEPDKRIYNQAPNLQQSGNKHAAAEPTCPCASSQPTRWAGTLPPWPGQPSAGRSGWGRWAWRWSCRTVPGTCAAWWARRWTGCGCPPPRPWGWPRTPSAWTRTAPTGRPCPVATAAGGGDVWVGGEDARRPGGGPAQGRWVLFSSAQPGTNATEGSCIHHSGTGTHTSSISTETLQRSEPQRSSSLSSLLRTRTKMMVAFGEKKCVFICV